MYGNAMPTISSIAPTPDREPTSSRPLAVVTLDLIRGARQRVNTLGLQATNIADRVFGAEPPKGVAGGANRPEPNCAKASFEVELRELHDAIEFLEQQLHRLEQVA